MNEARRRLVQAVRSLPQDLRTVALLALLAVPFSWLPLASWLELITGLTLVLLLPGYAIAAAAFPSRNLPVEETLVYTIGLSVTAVAIGGVLLQLIMPLNEITWPLLLAAITVSAVAVAAPRRRRWAERGHEAEGQPARVAIRSIGALATSLLVVALAIAAWSVEIATKGAYEQAAESRFTALWIVPRAEGAANEGATVGVENEEGRDTSYRLTVRKGPALKGTWAIDLADGESRQIGLSSWALRSDAPTVADLYREGRLYRRAYLNPEALR